MVGKIDTATKEISREIDPEQGVWELDGCWDVEPELKADESFRKIRYFSVLLIIKTWWSHR